MRFNYKKNGMVPLSLKQAYFLLSEGRTDFYCLSGRNKIIPAAGMKKEDIDAHSKAFLSSGFGLKEGVPFRYLAYVQEKSGLTLAFAKYPTAEDIARILTMRGLTGVAKITIVSQGVDGEIYNSSETTVVL